MKKMAINDRHQCLQLEPTFFEPKQNEEDDVALDDTRLMKVHVTARFLTTTNLEKDASCKFR